MTTKQTNWRTFIFGLIAVALSSLAIEVAAGRVPIPAEAAWLVPIAVPVLVFTTAKLREEVAAEQPPPDDLVARTLAAEQRRRDALIARPTVPVPLPDKLPTTWGTLRPIASDPRTDYWPETVIDPGAFPGHASEATEATPGPEPPGVEVTL